MEQNFVGEAEQPFGHALAVWIMLVLERPHRSEAFEVVSEVACDCAGWPIYAQWRRGDLEASIGVGLRRTKAPLE